MIFDVCGLDILTKDMKGAKIQAKQGFILSGFYEFDIF